MFCYRCGAAAADDANVCSQCGTFLRGVRPAAAAVAVTSGLDSLIPVRNAPALIAYYLGVFSVIPIVGFVLGVAAVVLGVMGLKRAHAMPEAKGKVHAWVGVLLGGLFGLIWLACGSFVIIGLALEKH